MSDISELDDALSNALHALNAAQAVLRKGASTRELDILRKANLADREPRAGQGDAIVKASLDMLADVERRMAQLEAQRDLEAAPRKTYTIEAA